MPQRRTVRWANQIPDAGPLAVVRTVPRGGREMEPGYVDRVTRHRALTKVHGIRVSKRRLDKLYGTPGSLRHDRVRGTRGTYTVDVASRDLWHARKHGGPWYEPVALPDRAVMFVSRYDNAQHRAMIAEMAANALRQKRRKR